MMAMAVQAGAEISPAEIVELMANTRSLYNLSTLRSRDFDRIDQCHALWQQTTEQFEQLCRAWEGVAPSGELIGWHRAQLHRLLDLASDRVELYEPEGADRRRLIANKRESSDSEYSFSSRGEIPA